MSNSNIKDGYIEGSLIRLILYAGFAQRLLFVFLNRGIEKWKSIWYAKCIKNTVKEDDYAY